MATNETTGLYTIQDGDTGKTVADGLDGNFTALYGAELSTAAVTRSSEQAVVTLSKRGGGNVQFGLPLAQTGTTSSQKLAGLMSPDNLATLNRGFKAWDVLKLLPTSSGNTYAGADSINPVTYDETAGTYTCQGVTGIDESQMWLMLLDPFRWSAAQSAYAGGHDWYCHFRGPAILWRPDMYLVLQGRANLFVRSANVKRIDLAAAYVNKNYYRLRLNRLTFMNCGSLEYLGELNVAGAAQIYLRECTGLTDLYLHGLDTSLDVRASSKLNYKSLKYIITNAGTPDTAKTITLHATVYAYVMGTNTNVPAETDADGNTVTAAMWQALKDALPTNFSIASA